MADEDALYFTTVLRRGQVLIKQLRLGDRGLGASASDVSVLPADTCLANNMTLGRDGALVVCEQGNETRRARISRVDRTTGAATILVDDWQDLALNSPNDVVERSDGSVWFTDPSYAIYRASGPRHAPAITYTDGTRPPERSTSLTTPSTSRTASPSPPTSRCSTSPTAARIRSQADSTATARTTSSPSMSWAGWGRPSVNQLWTDLQDLFRRTKAGFDPTTAQARAAWRAGQATPAKVPTPRARKRQPAQVGS